MAHPCHGGILRPRLDRDPFGAGDRPTADRHGMRDDPIRHRLSNIVIAIGEREKLDYGVAKILPIADFLARPAIDRIVNGLIEGMMVEQTAVLRSKLMRNLPRLREWGLNTL